MKPRIKYADSGVDYGLLDSLKRQAQKKAGQTDGNLKKFNAESVLASRGESAFVWEEADCYRAFVIEGLGTKNLVADELTKITGKNYYQEIAQDTVAAIVNDIITVGALPQVINAYFASGGPAWLENQNNLTDLVAGWAAACNKAGAVWGGGETPALSGIIYPGTIDLAGACVGIIKPKNRLLMGDKIKAGDAILLIESSGIHANGVSLARAIADKLPKKYATKLTDGRMFGEVLLTPAHIYVDLLRDMFDQEVDIHYLVNITGHGFRKLMRPQPEFSYVVDSLPPTTPVFEFIQKHSGNDDAQMYATFNMGAGLAIYLPSNQVQKAQNIAKGHTFKSVLGGSVQKGPRKVVIVPKKISFEGNTLEIR